MPAFDFLPWVEQDRMRRQAQVQTGQQSMGQFLGAVERGQERSREQQMAGAALEQGQQQFTAEQEQKALGRLQDVIKQAAPTTSELWSHAKDPQSYDQARRGVLGYYGMALQGQPSIYQLIEESIPSEYSPEWLENRKRFMQSLEPGATGKKVQKTVDLGDKQRVYYEDGSFEDLPKGAEPGKGQERTDKQLKKTTELRKEFLKQSGEFQKVGQSFRRIQASITDPSAAGDLALIFNYMKMLDPGSVVREGEFATAQNAAGIPDRIRAMYNKVASGERMAEKQRGDFWGRSKKLYQKQEESHKTRKKTYTGLSKKYGIDPDLVVIRLFPEQQQHPEGQRAQPAPEQQAQPPAQQMDMDSEADRLIREALGG